MDRRWNGGLRLLVVGAFLVCVPRCSHRLSFRSYFLYAISPSSLTSYNVAYYRVIHAITSSSLHSWTGGSRCSRTSFIGLFGHYYLKNEKGRCSKVQRWSYDTVVPLPPKKKKLEAFEFQVTGKRNSPHAHHHHHQCSVSSHARPTVLTKSASVTFFPLEKYPAAIFASISTRESGGIR